MHADAISRSAAWPATLPVGKEQPAGSGPWLQCNASIAPKAGDGRSAAADHRFAGALPWPSGAAGSMKLRLVGHGSPCASKWRRRAHSPVTWDKPVYICHAPRAAQVHLRQGARADWHTQLLSFGHHSVACCNASLQKGYVLADLHCTIVGSSPYRPLPQACMLRSWSFGPTTARMVGCLCASCRCRSAQLAIRADGRSSSFCTPQAMEHTFAV